jgi:fucose permease
MVIVVSSARFPRVERAAGEVAGNWQMYGELLRKPIVWAFFFCVFAYVGSEQGTADWISKFLSAYHRFDPHTVGATAVSWFFLIAAKFLSGFPSLRLCV